MSSSLRHHERGAGWRGTQSAQSDCAHLRPLLDQSERNQTKSSCPELRRSSRSGRALFSRYREQRISQSWPTGGWGLRIQPLQIDD